MTEQLLRDLFALMGAGGLPGLHEWLAVAADVGPVPEQGPLTHDILVPAPERPHKLGLNVFGYRGGLDAAARATAIARHFFEVPELPVGCHAGFAWVEGRPRLKIYASYDLPALAARFGGALPAGSTGIGFDVGPDGVSRWRTYALDAPELYAGFPTTPWPEVPELAEAKRLVTILDGPRPKRTLNTIFETWSPIEALLPLAHPETRKVLVRMAERAAEEGLRLRAVAHEIDVFADGTREEDVLVAVGSVTERGA